MRKRPEKSSVDFILPSFTRREWLRIFFGSIGLWIAAPCQKILATHHWASHSILERFLGEELHYQLGFWLLQKCGEAKTLLARTGSPRLYRASLEGKTLGLVDALVGRYRFSYTSFVTVSRTGDRFRPHHFDLSVGHLGKERHTTATFDYEGGEIRFRRTFKDRRSKEEVQPMDRGTIYEDYMTLFYNFRNGCYGPFKRGVTYRLPIYVHKGMKSLDVKIAPRAVEEKKRRQERIKDGKDFFLRFRVNKEDVSSKTGDIEGWLSSEAVPVKGTIKDVIFFGDLWGELVNRRFVDREERAST